MARTKHRKAHREALAAFRSGLRLQRHREQAGQPSEVAQGAYKVQDEPVCRTKEFLLDLRGRHATSETVKGLSQELPVRDADGELVGYTMGFGHGRSVQVHLDPEAAKEILTPAHQRLSMGCVAHDHAALSDELTFYPQTILPVGSIQPLDLPGITRPGNSHIEMTFHRDAEGKPVFDEISLCPGPDPNGITTLKSCTLPPGEKGPMQSRPIRDLLDVLLGVARRPVPAWTACPCCENQLCAIHGSHAHDCACPSLEFWDMELGVNPYEQGGALTDEHVEFLKARFGYVDE